MPAAPDHERTVEPAANTRELGVRHRADPGPRVPRLELEREPVAAEAVPALERELARRIGPRNVEARQRLVAHPLEPVVTTAIVAAEDLRETARPRSIERVLEGGRQRRPDLGG